MSFADEVQAVGSLRSPETTTVAADISGIIVALDAPEGRSVGEGHLIARLDDKEHRASQRVAEARRVNAKAALDRVRPLWEDGVVSQQDYDDAVAEMTTADGMLEETTTRLEKTLIYAPFSGIIGLQTAQVGQYVSSGDPIVQLTQVNPLELIFGVTEEEAGSVRLGQKVLGRVGRCGESFEGVVEALDPALDPATRTLLVQASVGNTERRLLPGMSARVRLQVGERDGVVVIPHEALAIQGTSYTVWIVGEDSGVDGSAVEGNAVEGIAVEARQVEPGRFLVEGVEIISGLGVGERIVGAGHQKLRPGSRVTPLPWQPTENPNLSLGAGEADDCL